MDEILEALSNDARLTAKEIAKLTGKNEETVKKAIQHYEKNGTIVKYKTVLHQDLVSTKPLVRALIEINVSPEKDVGFDHIAEMIYNFPEVTSCSLVSGTYDLLIVVEGETIQTVSNFIASKLASMENVRRTTTHFLLKKYKEDGHVFKQTEKTKRLNISY
ncbi:MAG: Lrp/AsnC family transcriptional regulator [Candidatus Omnitrophota bacterium]|nr:Lrp/AsnC family transcriptional regulator [Candidatus Omnitrophota bacterium]